MKVRTICNYAVVILDCVFQKMPSNAKVFIKYGPYEAVGVVDYRDARLKGLQGGYSLLKHFFTAIGVILHNCLGCVLFTREVREILYCTVGHTTRVVFFCMTCHLITLFYVKYLVQLFI